MSLAAVAARGRAAVAVVGFAVGARAHTHGEATLVAGVRNRGRGRWAELAECDGRALDVVCSEEELELRPIFVDRFEGEGAAGCVVDALEGDATGPARGPQVDRFGARERCVAFRQLEAETQAHIATTRRSAQREQDELASGAPEV